METLEPEVPVPRPDSGEMELVREAERQAGDVGAFVYFRRLERSGDPPSHDGGDSDPPGLEVFHLGGDKVDVGHHPHCELVIDWDPAVARAHAEIEKSGADWYVDNKDAGSATWVNGIRVEERMLVDGDELRFGDTVLVFRQPGLDRPVAPRKPAGEGPPPMTDAQRRVLVALVAPQMEDDADAEPANNATICKALSLAPDTVKGHLNTLFKAFGLTDLKPLDKRRELAARARETGAVTRADYL
jgi:hypothetical protein